jgi:hypothetical protein
MMIRRGIVASVLFALILAATIAVSVSHDRTVPEPSQPTPPLQVAAAPRTPAPAVTLRPWSGSDVSERGPATSPPVPVAAPRGQPPRPAVDPAGDDPGEELTRDITRRSGRPADAGVGSLINLWRAGRSKQELLEHAAQHVVDPLQRVMVDGWIRDRFDPPRGPAALGAGGASVHVPAVQAVH